MHTLKIHGVRVTAYEVPTETPESDGTLAWGKTTLVMVEIEAADVVGLGYSYADVATAKLIKSMLTEVVKGADPFSIEALQCRMIRAIRNLGRPGIVSMAIAAVNNALWDLKARLLDVSLVKLLGTVRDRAEIYGSGGFTSYSIAELKQQLGGWAADGFTKVKMKIGRDPLEDVARVRAAREAIGGQVELFVDANGAYSRKGALAQAERFAEYDVRWFEEPVSSDDLEGLRFLRDRAPAGMEIAAGEYGYDSIYFRRMLESQAVDVLQADATRCAGISGFLEAGILSQAFQTRFSFHCAPSMHAAVACAVPSFFVGEYFFDHSRIETKFFEGVLRPVKGALVPNPDASGFGLVFKRSDAAPFAV